MQWLKHAFAVDPPGPAEPTETERPVVDALCREIVRRRMTTPTLLFLEMSQPLNALGAAALHVLSPFASILADSAAPAHLATFLERRGSIDFLRARITELESTPRDQG